MKNNLFQGLQIYFNDTILINSVYVLIVTRSKECFCFENSSSQIVNKAFFNEMFDEYKILLVHKNMLPLWDS